MPPIITNGSNHFNAVIYEGNGGGQKVGNFVPFTDSGTIAKSVIYNRADTPKLTKTPSSNGNKRTYTISYWYKPSELGTRRVVFSSDTSGSDYFYWEFDASNKIDLAQYSGPALRLQTNRTFEDTTKFYHFLLAVDTTQSTAANRLKLYVDGDQITSFAVETYPSQDLETKVNSTSYPMAVGSFNSLTSLCTGGNLAEYNFVDGTALTPSTFGLTDTSTGRWIPKALTGITYGTNGFRMQFANSAGQTIGDDTSGNGNDYTVSGLAATDITTDSPTQNHATFSPSFSSSSMVLTQGNLTVYDNLTNNYESAYVGMPVQSGKYYFEVTLDVAPTYMFLGVNTLSAVTANINQYPGYADGSASYLLFPSGDGDYVYYGNSGNNYFNPGVTTSLSNGNILGVAYDADTGAFWVAKNNTWINSGNPSTGANPNFSGYTAGQLVYFSVSSWFSGKQYSFNFGQKSFNYTAPTGFKTLQQDNLPTTDKGISDLVWIKNRDATDSHQLYDSTRGPQKDLDPDASTAESTTTDGLQKFLKGGCQIEDDVSVNTSGESYVSWNWVCNGGTTSANTDGSGATIASTIQANQTAGFSIVKWTGNNTTNSKIAHGLSQAPEWIIVKNLSDATDWWVYHKSLTADKNLKLNGNDAQGTFATGVFDHSGITSTVFEVDNGSSSGNSINGNTDGMIAYCWHSVEGFSQFGSYVGTANTNGPFIFLGFKPAWCMVKNISTTGTWVIWDNKRTPINPMGVGLRADTTAADTSGYDIDFLSNGFKIRDSESSVNGNGNTIIYMAFAEHSFFGNGTNPATAR